MLKVISLTLVLVANSALADNWRPTARDTWQVQFIGNTDIGVDATVYDLDLFDTPKETIDALHAAGRKVICYLSSGTYEDWRDDGPQFPTEVIGKPLPEWPGEFWLDVRQVDKLMPIMKARLQLAKEKGCDGVDPDNMDGYTQNSGFEIKASDQIKYNRAIAAAAHELGLVVGLKNDLNQISQLVDVFDFSINEQCYEYNECDLLLPFVRAGKPVLIIEYQKPSETLCRKANHSGMTLIFKNLVLDAPLTRCATDGSLVVVPLTPPPPEDKNPSQQKDSDQEVMR